MLKELRGYIQETIITETNGLSEALKIGDYEKAADHYVRGNVGYAYK